MTQVASPESAIARFDGRELELYGETHRLERSGDELWIATRGRTRPGADGRPVAARRRVVMTTGSHHFQVYWQETGAGRRLEMFPLAFQIREGRWIPFDGLILSPPDLRQVSGLGGEWNTSCLMCHSVAPRPRVGPTATMDTEAAEFGIACEACHGPGEQHVAANRSPLRRYALHWSGRPDSTIVNPARLSALRSAQVCGQCHSLNTDRTPGGAGWLEHGNQFRPGDDLWETRREIVEDRPTPFGLDHFWDDGRVRGGGREYSGIVSSACFRGGQLSCLSCHALHQPADDARPASAWADDQLAPEMDGDRACTQCHAGLSADAAVEAHTHHGAGSSGSRCQNCHMPPVAFGLHKATRSHHIAIPTVSESVEVGRPNGCNVCHLDRTLAWTANWLQTWYGTPRPGIPPPHDRVAASVVWALAGDANQRGLMAFAMGWKPALEASGADWLAPYLAQLLMDPYLINRSVAQRSLRALPGHERLELDVTSDERVRNEIAWQIFERWQRDRVLRAGDPRTALLLDGNGDVRAEEFNALLARRDQRPMYLPD
jgi:hypothetical protein